jgi:ABC-type multidrug transport system permease subunit
MIATVLAIARSDLTRWRRSPVLVAATLIPAVGMSLTVFAHTYAVGRQPVAMVREGYGPISDRVVEILRESDGFFLRERTPEQAARDLEEQWVCAVIRIPKNFDEDVMNGKSHLEVTINNVDLDFSDDIRRSVSEAVVMIDAPELASLGEESETEGHTPAPPPGEGASGAEGGGAPAGINPYRIEVVETDLRRPDISFLAYQMVPVLALLALTAGALVTALSIAGDREGGRLRVLRLAPASRLAVVLGHLAGGTFAASLLLGIVVVALAIPGVLRAPPGRWPVVAALLLATAVGSTGLGVLVGLVTQRVTTTVLLGVNVASASFLLGGGFTTIAFLPAFIQNVAHAVPSFYAVEGLREALFYAEMPTLARNLTVLLGSGLLSVIVGTWLFAGSRTAPAARPTA